MVEQWKPIPDFPGYEVSDAGHVRSFKKCLGAGQWTIADSPQRFLKPSEGYGYYGINLCHQGNPHRRKIASLVLLAFVGPCPDGLEACHNNSDSRDNRLENLRYDTHTNNVHDRADIITRKQARSLREQAARGASDIELAKRYKLSVAGVAACRLGVTHKSAGGPIVKRANTKLTDREVECVRELRNVDRLPIADIAAVFGIHKSYVSYIARGLRR